MALKPALLRIETSAAILGTALCTAPITFLYNTGISLLELGFGTGLNTLVTLTVPLRLGLP